MKRTMKGRILLINPWIYDFAAYCEWSAPLGLLIIAAVLEENDYEVALIDCLDRRHPKLPPGLREDAYGCGKFLKTLVDKPAVIGHVPRRYGRYGLPVEVFQEELKRQPRPDVVFVTSGMTYWYPGPFEVIRSVKAHFRNVPVALGGIYATLCHDHATENSGAHYVFSGEGELDALRLADKLTGNESDLKRYSGGLDSLPQPLHQLRRNQGYVAIQTSRGCPFHCTYCASALLHPQGFRRRDPRKVADEIEFCRRKLGVRDFAFYDDALLLDADKHILPILDEVLRRGLDSRFHTPNGLHARFLSETVAAKMYEAGFRTVRIGLGTSNAVQQRRSGGKVNNTDFQQAVYSLQTAGFRPEQITAYILMGLPGQSVQEASDSVSFVHQCGASAQIALCSLIPCTADWQRAVHQGQVDADADPLLHNDSIYPFPWSEASLEDFERVKAQALNGNRALLPDS